MIIIHSLLQRIKGNKILYLQLLFVVLAFVLMIVSSSLYVNNMLKHHLRRDALDMLSQTKAQIGAELIEPQTTLAVVSNTIRTMMLRGRGIDVVVRYLQNIHDEMDKKAGGFMFDGFFIYFEKQGILFHSAGWKGGKDYDPTKRPWYKAAVDAGNKVGVTPVYFGLRSNQYVVTYAQRIFNDEGAPLGVVCLNMPLDRIRNHVVNMHIVKGGFGILMDGEMDIIAHPNKEFLGMAARKAASGLAMIADELELKKDIFEREFENYLGEWSVAFTMRLDTGWVLTLITPKAAYYQEMQNMVFIISIMGMIFAVSLIIILMRIDNAKTKADERSRHKGILLAEMEKLHETEKRTQLMLDATPLVANYWDKNFKILACNEEAVRMFGLKDKQEYLDRFYDLTPQYQPCGRLSIEMAREIFKKTHEEGNCRFEWMHQTLDGEQIPCEITGVRVEYKNEHTVLGYVRDLREHNQMMNKIEQRDKLLGMMNNVAVVLLAIDNEENMLDSIQKGMELLGSVVDVDRVEIWQNEMIDGDLHFVHKCEWLSEYGKTMPPVAIGSKFSYRMVPDWESKLQSGEYIN